MRLRYKKLEHDAYPPEKSRLLDAGMDFRCNWDLKWNKTGVGYTATASTGLAMEIPMGYYLATAPRSSVLFKQKISVYHSVLDTGYLGELTFFLHYIGEGTPPVIEKGHKIAQCVLIQTPMISTEFEEVDDLPIYGDRGERGFGSSGM